jgi:hypothetical protein
MFSKIVKLKDYQLLTLGWIAMLCLVCLNCTVHSLFIAKQRVDIPSSILWSLQEFGIWLLITPFICFALQRSMQLKQLMLIGVLSLACVLMVNTSLDVFIEQVTWQESLFYNWHKHAIAYLAIVTLVHFKSRFVDLHPAKSSASVAQTPHSFINQKTEEKTALQRLQIEECDIAIADIYFAKAAGNYVELHTKQGMSLLRTTMKELENSLPAKTFYRCHRSYLVNLSHSEKLINARSGHGLLVLNNDIEVPVSKSNRATTKLLLGL